MPCRTTGIPRYLMCHDFAEVTEGAVLKADLDKIEVADDADLLTEDDKVVVVANVYLVTEDVEVVVLVGRLYRDRGCSSMLEL